MGLSPERRVKHMEGHWTREQIAARKPDDPCVGGVFFAVLNEKTEAQAHFCTCCSQEQVERDRC